MKLVIRTSLIQFNKIFERKRNEDPVSVGLPQDIPHEVRHVVTFKDADDNKTEMTVTEYGYTSAQVLEMSKSGLEQCLDKMAVSLAMIQTPSTT
jgi:hypothetical protein